MIYGVEYIAKLLIQASERSWLSPACVASGLHTRTIDSTLIKSCLLSLPHTAPGGPADIV